MKRGECNSATQVVKSGLKASKGGIDGTRRFSCSLGGS